jgi:hypothetical protein
MMMKRGEIFGTDGIRTNSRRHPVVIIVVFVESSSLHST